MAEKRYHWLKLQEDFFSSKRIKKLRKLAGGDTYTIIYLKMQLMSVRNGGILKYSGIETTFAEELALDMDENPENVAVVLQYLAMTGLIETSDEIEYLLPYAAMNIGSETESAERMRRVRAKKKEEASHCSHIVEQCDLTRDLSLLSSSNSPSSFSDSLNANNNIQENKSEKHSYGDYGWVKLTDAQYEKLEADLGIEELKRCIEYIDEAAQSTGNKNKWKDWNLVIRRCAKNGWGKSTWQKKEDNRRSALEEFAKEPEQTIIDVDSTEEGGWCL